jgi:hypothetical protein
LSPKKVEFARHVFATFTYEPHISDKWGRVSKDYNRYLQEIRRLHNVRVAYLRVVEQHKNGAPHIHALLQFPSAQLRVQSYVQDRRARKKSPMWYFDKALYSKWKSLWRYGHSDYQRPRRGGVGPISYMMKYLLKNQTQKTVWRKVIATQTSTDQKSSVPLSAAQIEQRSCANLQKTPMDGLVTNTMPVRKFGVKLCSWSRNFDFTPFYDSSYK